MSLRSRAVVALVLLTFAVAWPAATAAAAGRQQQIATPTTTVMTQDTASDDRSAALTVLLVGVGAAVGVIVGVIPAVVAATLLGYLPPPRRPASVLVEPPRHQPQGEPEPERVAPPEPVVLAVAGEPPPRSGQLAILAHARHQSVYDSAYAEQLDRVETLRARIGGRRRLPRDPDPSED
jgi:hypothetical protein